MTAKETERYIRPSGIGMEKSQLPFPDDSIIPQTQFSAVPNKRTSRYSDRNPKRQCQSPRPDSLSQRDLSQLNVTKNVTPSSTFVAKNHGPFPEETTAKSSFSSGINTPVTKRNGQQQSQSHAHLYYGVKSNSPYLEPTQETAQPDSASVEQVHIKREDENESRGSGPGESFWNGPIDKTDYFADGETLQDEDWLNLPCEKVIKEEPEETYSIGSLDEKDMINLADTLTSALKQTPSTSVLKDIDASSTIEVFDPSLQHSPPVPPDAHLPTKPKQSITDEELLDEDVDWDAIMLQIPLTQKDPSLSPQLPTPTVPIKAEATPSPPPISPKPFTRPAFPAPLRNKSPIAGLSATTVFRTCFRVGHFISEGTRCHHQKQDAIFELYARVKCSSRENNRRVQHFQFVDMFKDQRPYPRGILNGWKTGSLLEKRSAAFLQAGSNNGEEKMCRCICRLIREKKNELGWLVDVLSIEEANWNDVQVVKGVVCREQSE